jgi:hypothetical protein
VVNRHALLIGVPRYDEEEFNVDYLEAAVYSDIAAMRTVLAQSDYTITECGIGNADRGGATLGRINRAIEEACADAAAGSTLLVYFSGHGVTVDGADYLLPSEAYRFRGSGPDGPPVWRNLIPVVPAEGVLRDCRAGLVAVFVDACRNGQFDGQPSVEPGGMQPFLADGGQFVQVMGCAAGQTGRYDESGSAFTQSLVKALDPRNPARTLSAVVDFTAADLRRRFRQSQGDPQEPAVRNPDVLRRVGQTEICDGDELTEAWRKAVDTSPLLALCESQGLVRETVEGCASRCGAATLALRSRTGLTDPWTDQDYPVRVLRNTELLLRDAGFLPPAGGAPDSQSRRHGEAGGLLPGEAAVLMAAPFLREAVLAVGIRDAAGIDPADMRRTYTVGMRGDLELTHEMYPHLVRRAAGLGWRGDSRVGDQIALWLVHRWLTGRLRLWDEAGAQEVYDLGATLITGCRGNASEREAPRLVQALLLAVGAEPADERLVGRLAAAYVSERWRFLAAVVWLAGIMAADPRRLPPVIADLIGTGMELPLTEVQYAAGRQAGWIRGADGGLDLRFVCEHPALHDAFEDIVRRAAVASETARSKLALPARFAAALPAGFTARELRPATGQDDEPVYEAPPSRFQIAEEKVRELIMGRQLYGDPALAIRELYQNALDACRWRATRQEYLERTGQSPPAWTGLIRFAEGTDADGRRFIDCEDNGVGMDIGTIKHVFANAGERFVYGQEFRAEQAAWADLDLQMIPNSQFGVGVFSYFMLADEITVLTRHQRRDGVVAGQAHEVRIASSGSLFQVRPASGLPGGGTRVRLYLSGDATGVSALAVLRELLWTAEHRVVASDPHDSETWEPGELRYPEGDVKPLKCGDDLWWVPGQGGLAADGIAIGAAMFGLVVNLRHEHRPQFTVDRKTLRSYDADWVDSQVRGSLPHLMEWPGFTLSWLWRMSRDVGNRSTSDDLARSQQIFEFGIGEDKHVEIDSVGDGERLVPLRAAGCLASDDLVLEPGTQYEFASSAADALKFSNSVPESLKSWRVGVWRDLGHEPSGLTRLSSDRRLVRLAPEEVAGFPVPDAIDGALLSEAEGVGSMLSAAVRAGLTPHEASRRWRRYAIIGLDLSAARTFSAIERLLSDSDVELITRLRSLITAEEPQHGELVQILVKAGFPQQSSPGLAVGHARLRRLIGWADADPARARLLDAAVADADQIWESRTRQDLIWLMGVKGPAMLMGWATRRGLNLAQVLDRCAELARLGITVPGLKAYSADFGAVELAALPYLHTVGTALSLADLLLIAADSGVTLHAAHVGLSRLEERGLLVRPPLDDRNDYGPTSQDCDLIKGNWPANRVRSSGTRARRQYTWMRVAQILTRPRGRDEDLLDAARSLAPVIAPDHPLSFPELAMAAWLFQLPLGETASALGEVYPGLQLPDLPARCGDLLVADGAHDVLITEADEISWRRPLPERIVNYALSANQPLGDFLARLGQFRELGAPVPPCTDAVRQALNEVRLDDRDAAPLRAGNLSVLRVWPLHLVQTAGRFGWTLAEAHRRFARLVPIGLELDYPHDDIPDEIVYWYDLLALTTHFDGQPPEISGKIDWAYLERAAEEIFDCAPAEVPAKAVFLRDRLRIYAPLFDFELPEETASA